MIFREVLSKELYKIARIDRGEEISEVYIFQGGKLLLQPQYETVQGFDQAELDMIIVCQNKILAEGGHIFGAFIEDQLIGVASVEKRKRGKHADFCKMDILYVHRSFRRKGIAKTLLEECKNTALSFGAKNLYISATPTKATVDFYMQNGAVLVQEFDSELYEMEPLDIHLQLPLNTP